MNSEHVLIVGTTVTVVTQALKPARVPDAFLPVTGILIGVTVGLLLAYAESGVAGLADGAVEGIVGALTAFGGYSGTKALSEYTPRPRDARGRFVAKDD